MMKLTITHDSTYQFEKAVFLEPHILRFKPIRDPFLNLMDFELKIRPKPAGLSEQVDVENNINHFCWFEGLHEELTISINIVVEVEPFNPFNYLIYPKHFLKIPFSYNDLQAKLMQSALEKQELPQELIAFVENLLATSNHDTSAFLMRLTQQIHEEFTLENREEGEPMSPELTFQLHRGSCRDLTWMEMQLLRYLDIATRFVSGYFYLDVEEPTFELHAWLEVYVPGAGWLGFDPSHGIATGHTHIAVAKSAQYQNTMPVSGTVRGDAKSSLSYHLHIDKV